MKNIKVSNFAKKAVQVMMIAAAGATLQIIAKAPWNLNGMEIHYNVELISAIIYTGTIVVIMLGLLAKKIVHRARA